MSTDHLPTAITCASGLIAACAPLLGFTPERCLVAFVHGVPHRRAPVILRVDLPAPGDIAEVTVTLVRGIVGTAGLAVDTVAWVEDPDLAPKGQLASAALHSQVRTALAAENIEVGAVLSTNGAVWWSHVCDEAACCPQRGTALDQRAMDAVRAEFAYAGISPMSSREHVAARVRRDQPRADALAQVMSTRPVPNATSRWRTTQIRHLTDLLMPGGSCASEPCPHRQVGPITTARSARTYAGLADIAVRDVLLHRLAMSDRACRSCWEHVVDTLCTLVRAAPDGNVAPVATVLAVVAWLQGQGALANLALERADDEPGYRLAALAGELVARGTDPAAWRESLAAISEAQCRNPSRVVRRSTPGGL